MPIKFEKTTIYGLLKIIPHQFKDERGYFCKYFQEQVFLDQKLPVNFTEFNVNMTYNKGSLKGLAYQHNPSQGKLVYRITGTLFDVALDLRKNSPTFGKYECFYLSKEQDIAIYIPEDFAHGCLILEDNTIICEQFSGKYVPQNGGRILWNDRDLNIPWPINTLNVPLIISEKEKNGQSFSQYKKVESRYC
jgi:dTDP-4-dehydrorhamnose 3,5-epimerase